MQLVLRADAGVTDQLSRSVEVLRPWPPTHFGTREMVVLDPDGRQWTIQEPSANDQGPAHWLSSCGAAVAPDPVRRLSALGPPG